MIICNTSSCFPISKWLTATSDWHRVGVDSFSLCFVDIGMHNVRVIAYNVTVKMRDSDNYCWISIDSWWRYSDAFFWIISKWLIITYITLLSNRVSTTSGNTGNILEFKWSSWKFLYNRSVIKSWQEWHPVIKFSCIPVIGNLLDQVD